MSDTPVSPEYRELHEFHCRCAEIREALLRECSEEDSRSVEFGELLERYWRMATMASNLMVFLHLLKAADPALWEKWRKAAMVNHYGTERGTAAVDMPRNG